MRIGKTLILVFLSLVLCIGTASWIASTHSRNAALALLGQSRDEVVRQLGTPNVKVSTAQLQNPLFSPPARCSNVPVAAAYVYYRSFGRDALLVYFDLRGKVTCVSHKGLGLL